MKLVTAIVPPSRVKAVKDALVLFGVGGLTASHVQVTSGSEHREYYRGVGVVTTLMPCVRLDVLASDDDTPDVVRVIASAAALNEMDLPLWVTRVDYLVRVRTGEYGLDAL
jgi:nitrogen regulatory protein P-II 1